MALAAVGGEAPGAMIRIFGCIETLRVAAVAIGGKSEAIELAHSPHLVARVAVDYGVGTNQREAILVLVDVVDRHLPAVGVMAELAFGSILAAVQVGMAVLTFVGSVGEFEIGVAVATSDGGVPSA